MYVLNTIEMGVDADIVKLVYSLFIMTSCIELATMIINYPLEIFNNHG